MLDLEQLEAGDAAAAHETEPQVLALERAALDESSSTSPRDDDAVSIERRPRPAPLEALIRREVPEQGIAVDVGVRVLDPAESLQKREPGGGVAPQLAQTTTSFAPQPLQNVDPAGGSCPHCGQFATCGF
jgi:hypothetical protein